MYLPMVGEWNYTQKKESEKEAGYDTYRTNIADWEKKLFANLSSFP
jgi:hypothetical protein